jgi:hypothetical protein
MVNANDDLFDTYQGEMRMGNLNGYVSYARCIRCGHPEDQHDMRFDEACWHGAGVCDCESFGANQK